MTDLPEEISREVHQQELRQVSYSEGYAGPLPPPELLNQFDDDTRAAIVSDFVAHSHITARWSNKPSPCPSS